MTERGVHTVERRYNLDSIQRQLLYNKDLLHIRLYTWSVLKFSVGGGTTELLVNITGVYHVCKDSLEVPLYVTTALVVSSPLHDLDRPSRVFLVTSFSVLKSSVNYSTTTIRILNRYHLHKFGTFSRL